MNKIKRAQLMFLVVLSSLLFTEVLYSKNKESQQNGSSGEKKILSNEKLNEIINKIKYLNSTDRVLTIKSLSKLTEEDKKKFYDFLAEVSLNDYDSLVRESALKFLADEKADCSLCIESYKKNLFYEGEKVRLQALRGIENLKLANLQQEFLELIQKTDFSQNDVFVNNLIRTLGVLEYNQNEITDQLIKKYKEETTHLEVKRSILLYAGNSKNDAFKTILIDVLDKEEDIYTKSYAINALGKLATKWEKQEKEAIIQRLKEEYNRILSISNPKERAKNNPLKQHLIVSLVRLEDESVKEEIKKLALDDDANIRIKALEFIEDLELKDYIEILKVKYKYDPSKSVKNKAKEILQKWNALEEK